MLRAFQRIQQISSNSLPLHQRTRLHRSVLGGRTDQEGDERKRHQTGDSEFMTSRRFLSSEAPPKPPQQGWLAKNGPGLLASAGVMQCAFMAADQVPWMSGVPLAIMLGVSLRHFALSKAPQLQNKLDAGLKVASSTVLRTGIVCVGAKLSAFQVAQMGLVTLPAVAASISAGLIVAASLSSALGIEKSKR